MSKTRFASASLLALGLCLTACGEGSDNTGSIVDDLAPYRGDWQIVMQYPFDLGVSSLTIGGAEDDGNWANRGDVEVFFTDTDQITVQFREFTFAASQEEADEDFGKMSPWINTGSKVIPAELDPAAACASTDPDTNEPLWQDGCGIHLYYDGQSQKLRVGADIRVFLPAAWEGTLNIVTEDNVAELETYPDRGDVTVVGMRGYADIVVDSGLVNVRLADETEPVPNCNADQNQQCADAGWDQTDPAVCPCVDFGRVDVSTRGPLPVQATVDAPSNLWAIADLNITKPGLGANSPCASTIQCDQFDSDCNWLDNDPNKPFDRRAEVNKPANSIEGIGYKIGLESGDCATIETVSGPEQYTMPDSVLRGELEVCSGCLSDLEIPAVPSL